jgi:multidrug transporter EmrE-like cation transporter
VSGGVEVAYFVFLAAAYRRGDLSVVYPLARGSAPLFAVVIGVVILGERLPPAGWAGVGLILAGLLAIQRPWRFLGLNGPGPQRAAAGFALLTGIMIATYSGLDRVGVQQVPPWLYAGILWPTCALGLGVVWLVRGRLLARERAAVSPGAAAAVERDPRELRRVLAWGLMMLLAYGFVLAAYSRAPLVIVGPLREVSLVLTSIWAVVRLREAVDGREATLRVGGAVLVLGGAIVLALAG